MSFITTIASWYKTHRDETLLAISIGIILLSGVVIGQMVGRAFAGNSGLRESVRSLISFVPLLDLVGFVSIGIGIYLGLLALLFFDFKKRIQSVLLIIGTVVSFGFIWASGVMFTAMSLIHWVVVFVVALLTMFKIGGETLSNISIKPNDIYRNRVFTTERDEPIEFPKAATYLWVILAGFIVIALHEAYTQYPEFILAGRTSVELQLTPLIENYKPVNESGSASRDIIASVLFLTSFRVFLQYDAGKQIVFVGPPRSGKTHLIIGLFVQAQNNNLNPRDVSSYVTDQKDFIVANEEWAEETEAEIHEMGFSYTTPGLFSKNIVVDGLDYPGEYSYFIPEGLELVSEGMEIPEEPVDYEPPVTFGTEPLGRQIAENQSADESRWKHLIENFDNGYEERYKSAISDIRAKRGTSPGGGINADVVYMYMVNSVLPRLRDADVIGFVFDTGEHSSWEQDGTDASYVELGYYQRIMDVSNADQSIGIATKSDELRNEFIDESHMKPDDDYPVFRDYVNNRLLGGPFSGELQALQVKPYPVYIENTDNASREGPKVPLRTYGMDEVLNKLG